MLSLISLGRGLWQKLQTAHPVIRWGGAILVGLVVLEFTGDEAINLYIKMQTARATIERQNAEAATAAAQSRANTGRVAPIPGYGQSVPGGAVDWRADCAQLKQMRDAEAPDQWAALRPDVAEKCRSVGVVIPQGAADQRADCLELEQKHVANPADIIEACRSVGVVLSQGNAATESDADFLKRFRKDPVSAGGGCTAADLVEWQRVRKQGPEGIYPGRADDETPEYRRLRRCYLRSIGIEDHS